MTLSLVDDRNIQFLLYEVLKADELGPVSYTHLTLPTNREV